MAGKEWKVGHLQGRIVVLEMNYESLKALFNVCYMQSRVLFAVDDSGEDEITMVGLFRLGNFILDCLKTNLDELREIADAGLREARTAVKGGK